AAFGDGRAQLVGAAQTGAGAGLAEAQVTAEAVLVAREVAHRVEARDEEAEVVELDLSFAFTLTFAFAFPFTLSFAFTLTFAFAFPFTFTFTFTFAFTLTFPHVEVGGTSDAGAEHGGEQQEAQRD